jgi:chorismate synthase
MSNIFGKKFRIINWGESHGKAIGAIIEGCPPLLPISEKVIQKELDRRKPGQSKITSQRKEADRVEILSGVFHGKTTGAPLSLIIWNKNHVDRKKDYDQLKDIFRPGHADFTYHEKYGISDYYGGGRSSARITAGNVAAGAVAKRFLRKVLPKLEIIAYVKKVKDVEANVIPQKVSPSAIESNIIRCPDTVAAKNMIYVADQAKARGDSVGGIIECIIKNPPVGLGEPIFNKLSADLAKAMMSINAAKGFEIGAGFRCAEMFGSECNDQMFMKSRKIVRYSNNAGGVEGGISSGENIIFRVAFKPASSIAETQSAITTSGKNIKINIKGKHDACFLPRAVPIVEAMAALVLADSYMINEKLRDSKKSAKRK